MNIEELKRKNIREKLTLENRYGLFCDELNMLHHDHVVDTVYHDGLAKSVKKNEKDFSENSLLFTATFFLIVREFGINPADFKHCPLFTADQAIKYNKDSHDNKTGYVGIRSFLGTVRLKPWQLLRGRNWFHPRDLIFWSAMKGGIGSWLMWLVEITNTISCKRTYREKPDGRKEITTSGKMLALTRVLMVGDYEQFLKLTNIIYENPVFGSWERVASIYFKNDLHPTRYACMLLDEKIKSGHYEVIKEMRLK